MQISDDKFRELADNIPTLCWMADPDGYIFWYNRRWYEYTGTTPQQMEGWGWQSVHDPIELPSVLERWRTSIATGKPFEMVFPLRAANGQFSPFLTRINPTTDAEGKITGWFGVNTNISDQLKAERERSLVAAELNHRIKNIFAVIAGLVSLSAKNFPEAKNFAANLEKRIAALGYAHDYIRPKIEGGSVRATRLFTMIHELLAPYQDGARVVTLGQDIEIDDRAVTALALLYHELATNAAKYGAFSVPSGKVSITSAISDNAIQMTWSEEDGPTVIEPDRSGFGSRLALLSVEGQLGGSLAYDWKKTGLCVIATVPVSSVTKLIPEL